jgi:hypothetical protein
MTHNIDPTHSTPHDWLRRAAAKTEHPRHFSARTGVRVGSGKDKVSDFEATFYAETFDLRTFG